MAKKLRATAKQTTKVLYTSNFGTNLDDIEQFCTANNHESTYDRLLEYLRFTVVPSLEHHIRIGKPFSSQFRFDGEALDNNLLGINISNLYELVFDDY